MEDLNSILPVREDTNQGGERSTAQGDEAIQSGLEGKPSRFER